MARRKPPLESLLDTAERLLAAREIGIIASEEWDSLQRAASACREPAAVGRAEVFSVDDGGAMVRAVVPKRGHPYRHRCPPAAFQAVALAASEAEAGFNLEDLQFAAGVTWTEAAVAFGFLKDRGVVSPSSGRSHTALGPAAFEHAMIEYHAMRGGPAA